MTQRITTSLLNLGHALDHMVLLIFATAVTRIAEDFGIARWEDLMPYSVAAFFFFGVGSLPAGKLGDHWGRRSMIVLYFVGLGASAILVSHASSPAMLAVALGLLGAFAAIYHPVGVPMLVQNAKKPGWTIGVSGLCGNLGIALAAAVTGYLVQYFGWRAAFAVPGAFSIGCGAVFALCAGEESAPPAKRKPTQDTLPVDSLVKLLFVMTLASTSGSLLFNFSTNSNYELLVERLADFSRDPARIGLLLSVIYAVASLMQLVVGKLIDRYSLKRLYLSVIALQAPFLIVAAFADGWFFYASQLCFMIAVFGAIPFTDAMIVRFVDDSMRSRVAGMRFAVSFGASSLAVWLLGPLVKAAGFTTLLLVMAGISVLTFLVVSRLPNTPAPKPAA